jgi:hypothetical protein
VGGHIETHDSIAEQRQHRRQVKVVATDIENPGLGRNEFHYSRRSSPKPGLVKLEIREIVRALATRDLLFHGRAGVRD